jgi:molecular chaperone GrpE
MSDPYHASRRSGEAGPESEDMAAEEAAVQPEPAAVEAEPGEDESAALAQQVAELKDRLLRAVAETENVRRRAEREKQDAAQYGIAGFARDMANVADNLRRALDSISAETRAQGGEAVQNLLTGVEMTERELLSAFERHRIRRIDAMGEKFDPHLHQAMFEVPRTDAPSGTVVEVVQPGWAIGERLLRPAMVGVAKAAGDGTGPDGGTQGSAPGRVDTSA